MPNWRTITPSNDPRHMVRGTELESYIPDGFNSRFAVYAVRTVERDPSFTYEHVMMYDRRYIVRDAHTVSDEQLRLRRRPEIVAQFATEIELDAWLAQQSKAVHDVSAHDWDSY